MITTITLNPSVDKRYDIEDFHRNGIFRPKNVERTAGGKGLNVARIVHTLGEPVIASGFLGGENGNFISKELDRLDIENRFIDIKEHTRNCIAILSKNSGQTEILESGPKISKKELNLFLEQYTEMISKTDIICASGSLPENIPSNIYRKLIKIAKKKNIKFILDTSGEALIEGIKEIPYLIKPNKKELEIIEGKRLDNEEDIITSGRRLVNKGIEFVVISLGKKGSIVLKDDKIFRIKVPKVKVRNPVGSGDAMVAGFAVGLRKGYNLKNILSFAASVGTANAMNLGTGTVKLKNINNIMSKVFIEGLK